MSEVNCKPLPQFTDRDLRYFWKYVDRSPGHGPHGDCWRWTGRTNELGYGWFRVQRDRHRTSYKASRVSFMLNTGSDPYPFLMRHACDWPPCVNPGHLLTGTVVDNIADKVARNRHQRGEAVYCSRLTVADVTRIREMFRYGMRVFEIVPHFTVGQTQISRIIARKEWTHIP